MCWNIARPVLRVRLILTRTMLRLCWSLTLCPIWTEAGNEPNQPRNSRKSSQNEKTFLELHLHQDFRRTEPHFWQPWCLASSRDLDNTTSRHLIQITGDIPTLHQNTLHLDAGSRTLHFHWGHSDRPYTSTSQAMIFHSLTNSPKVHKETK